MTTHIEISVAVRYALEASASLDKFGRLGYSAAEALLGQANSIAARERVLRVDRQQLGLEAIASAIRAAAEDVPNCDRRKLLESGANALDALSRIDALSAVRLRS